MSVERALDFERWIAHELDTAIAICDEETVAGPAEYALVCLDMLFMLCNRFQSRAIDWYQGIVLLVSVVFLYGKYPGTDLCAHNKIITVRSPGQRKWPTFYLDLSLAFFCSDVPEFYEAI
jgi:hypothetical protein